MKKKSVLLIVAFVFFLSLACQTLIKPTAPPTPENGITPQVTDDAPVVPDSNPLTGLIYSIYDTNSNSGALWQIGNDGQAQVILNNFSALFSPDGTQAAYINYSERCSWLVDYAKKEAKPLDCSSADNPEFYTIDQVVGWMPDQPDKLLMLFDVAIAPMGGSLGHFGTLSISSGEWDVLDSQHDVSSAALSPNGKMIAYSGWTNGGVYSFDYGDVTSDLQQYGVGKFALTNPAWSPDGNKIAWGLTDANSEFKLAVGIFDLESKTAQVLHPHSRALLAMDGPPPTPAPIWSSDGQWVVFYANVLEQGAARNEEESGWWVLRADGSAEYKLDGEFYNWSPDGQWIISWKKENPASTTANLMTVHPDGTDATAITEVSIDQYGQVLGQALWAPDGNHLAVVDANNAIWITETGSWQLSPISGTEIPQGAQLYAWTESLLPAFDQLTVLPLPTPSANSNFSCPSVLRTRLQVGDTARVAFTDGKKSFLRFAPEAGDNVIDSLPEGTGFEIIDGPICAMLPERTDAYIYWKVIIASRNNETGWLAEGDAQSYYLEPWP